MMGYMVMIDCIKLIYTIKIYNICLHKILLGVIII